MDPRPHEPPPTITDLVLGQIIMAGAMLIIVAIPVGLVLPLKVHSEDWDWQWSIILGAVNAIVFATVGGVLVFVGTSIAKWRWKMQGKSRDSPKR
jgi:hypothetical protein